MDAGGKIRVLLADDHALLRSVLKGLVDSEPDMEVVGEADDGRQALTLAEILQPDVVVMDISMPRMSGLEATQRIRERRLRSRVLVLTAHTEPPYLREVLRAGGAGYVLKQSAGTALLDGIRAVARGEAFVDRSATRMLLDAVRQGGHPGAGRTRT